MKSIYKRFTKRTLLSILIVHFSMLSFAATYYVSSTGNDTNSGLATTLAWKTLAKVNTLTFNAGDQVLFQRGDTFYGSLNVKNSGTSGLPITLGTYGTGANPIITGFTTISAWTNLGSNIWESTNAVSTLSNCNMVTINGINTPMGRYPNTGYLTINSHNVRTSITCTSLTGTPNWTGSELVVKTNDWVFDRVSISSQSSSTLNYTGAVNNDPIDGYGFFIQNHPSTLDQQNEWYYSPTTHKIRIYSTSQPVNVKIASVDNLLTLNGNYITIDGLAFEGANLNSIFRLFSLGAITYPTIKNCTFNFSGQNAIEIRCTNATIDNNVVSNSNNNAIECNYSSSVNITNNSVSNTGALIGMGMGEAGNYTGIALYTSNNVLIQYNKVINTGFNGITFYGSNTLVKNNFVDTYNFLLDDGGGIYTYTGSQTQLTGIEVKNNICINGIGAPTGTTRSTGYTSGIYLDQNSKNVELSGNTIANNSLYGIFLNDNGSINVHDNLSYNNNVSQIYLVYYQGITSPAFTIQNNLFIAKSSTQICAYYRTASYDIKTLGTINSNYYARPILDTNPIRGYSTAYPLTNYSLASWVSFSGYDALSSKSPKSITNETDLQFEYNNTSTAKAITLSSPMIDAMGNKYSTTITLQPYTSAVLMKDLTAAIVPSTPTSVVATAGNASASVTFAAPVSNGGSAITGYTVTSIPAGGIDANAGSTALNHSITGLTNGTSYTFTVKATNSVGSSVASAASNSVIPKVPVATGFLFTGPSSGSVNNPSANFTVTPNNLYTGTITVTPSGMGSAGLSPKVLTFSNSAIAQTFTITPTVAGSITLTATNNGTLINPVPITYTTNAILPDAPTSVVATSADGIVSVTFMAPTNTGGSAITGYTVTSSPAGGIDSNAGSTSLTHTITGLTNGTYTFTVKATSSVGSSVASVASNPIENIITKQGEIVPSHFTTVWQGLNGLNHMNINVVSAVLEDVPLSVDDEIAVFSGSTCVGTSKLIQSVVPTDNSTFLTILASQNDGSGNGFTDNDTIVFKIWNSKAQTELQINTVVYRNDITTWNTNGRYSPGATTVVEIASYQVYTQSIELLKGYNMISTYVSAQNPNVSAVTKTILDQGNLIKLQDETGNSFENWGTFGGWINQLGSLEETEGYKIQVANNCTLQVTGRIIAMPFDISLKAGWNIISFPRTDVVNAQNVVQALIDQNKLVKVQDEAGNSIENWGLFGGWKNGIGNFIPGKAYKVKMSADAILTFQESYPKSAVVIAKSEQTEYYSTSVEGNGTDHMNINLTGLNNIGISVGDELAAFDGAVCVATTKITEANLLSGSASLVASFLTDNQNPNGFKSGNPIQISVWNKLSGDESKVNAEVLSGQMKYEKNATVLVEMKSATITTGIIHLNDVIKIDVFPNPSQDHLTVRFSEMPEANSRIEISDISGRKLISRLISGTSEEFNLDSFTPGLYLVRSILGKSEFVQKLIVNK